FEDIPKDESYTKEFGEVKVWDLATRKERTLFHGDTGRVRSVAFSPDGKTLAAGVRDGTIRLWDVATGKELASLREKAHAVRAVAFSADGKTLAAVDEERPEGVKLWDLASERVRARLQGHAGHVSAVDLASGRVRARLQGDAGYVSAVAFSPDGPALATAGN